VPEPYEKLKAFTRGVAVTQASMQVRAALQGVGQGMSAGLCARARACRPVHGAEQQQGEHRARPAATWCSVGVCSGHARCHYVLRLCVFLVCTRSSRWAATRAAGCRSPSHFGPNPNPSPNQVCTPVCVAGRQEFVAGLDGLPEEARTALAALTPATYVGNAAAQARAVRGHL
jgi:hypothetical protein